ncbi:hypothetical protein X798_03228 [Onchocerca flexuosa]|uniref:Uncharacterized protein n=1 Tax=Onchocerca flexuosa TaxID=387005 RepID=A0A238BYG2_9BILA|nr:hypothetical protein X798_03228 [Onchocerca flexuosa]
MMSSAFIISGILHFYTTIMFETALFLHFFNFHSFRGNFFIDQFAYFASATIFKIMNQVEQMKS